MPRRAAFGGSMANEKRKCVGCDVNADFSANLVAYQLRSSPKVTTSTQAIGICEACCQPTSPNYLKLSKILICWLYQVNNQLHSKARQQSDLRANQDQKTAAAGGNSE